MGSTSQSGHVMTLANSIIGVAILSMPFCFQKCGILLSIVLLVIINVTTRVCCHYLIKSSILCRRRSMEIMALHVFGPSGKLMVELCTIGYMMGTCVAYFVVVGDLGPQIISKMLDIAHTDTLRIWIMLLVTAVCVIPLGLLKNVDSLSTVCTASIGFYFCLVIKVMAEAREQIFGGQWLDEVYLWRWSGVLQCLPIFSLSLSCQIVIFEVYESVANASLSRMNDIVKSAISMCTCVYIAVGFFGYVAFFKQEFSGNILLNLEPSMTSDVIQMGFVMSVACSFPLIIFPCRASLYSLLYQRDHSEVAHYIPEHRFRVITLAIIIPALIIGILTPSIELIIGLVGSTIGVAICIMFPATCFIKLGKRDSSELLLAKFMLVFGFFLMVLGTYANLEAFEDRTSGLQSPVLGEHLHNPIDADLMPAVPAIPVTIREPVAVADRIVVPTALAALSVAIAPDVPLGDGLVSKLNAPMPVQPAEPEPIADELIVVKAKHVDAAKHPPEPEINRDAIAHEEHEIAIEAKQKIDELKETKELVLEIKMELAKQNEKTQQLVMEKFEQIVDKVEHIEKVQEEAAAKSQAVKAEDEKPKAMLDSSSSKLTPVPSSPTNSPVSRKVIETDDPIINLIQKKSKIETRSLDDDRIATSVQTSLPPAKTNAIDDSVKIVPPEPAVRLPPVDQTTASTDEPKERVARDLLGLQRSTDH